MSSSPHDSGGRNQQMTQPNSNSSIYHPETTTTNNINNNNNNSQNTENNHNNDALNKSNRCQDNQEDGPLFRSHHLVTPDNDHRMSKKSPSHESHFSGGSGILADTPPKRPERRQYVNKSKLMIKTYLPECYNLSCKQQPYHKFMYMNSSSTFTLKKFNIYLLNLRLPF